MDMEVLLQPPMLYLVCVLLWWGVQFVPFALSEQDHFMVFSGAVVHCTVYAWLLSLSVPEEPWIRLVASSVMLVSMLLTGGFLLYYLQTLQERRNPVVNEQGIEADDEAVSSQSI